MAGLTKQHFNSIAKIIKGLRDTQFEGSIDYFKCKSCGVQMNLDDFESILNLLTDNLGNYFKTQNPMFNKNQFKKACLE